MKLSITREQKLAKEMIESVDSVTLDLDEVGVTIAQISPSVLFNRLEVIVEAAREEKERMYERRIRNSFRD